MAKFSKNNFHMIINEIQDMEKEDQNIWVPVGCLEMMYEDDFGLIDYYFHSDPQDRNIDWLWKQLNN